MKLPLMISVPHAGLSIPPEVEGFVSLSREDVVADGDEGAAVVYSFEGEVDAFVMTSVARAIVDVNRAEDDRRPDGVVKTHTCWNVPVYKKPPPDEVIEALIERYYRPYHKKLNECSGGVILGVDCHTMAAKGPPAAPDAGKERPKICLSDGEGKTAPRAFVEALAERLGESFDTEVYLNEPFSGGYITRSRPGGIPWVQLEVSRAPFMPDDEKKDRVLSALKKWVAAR